MNRVIVKVDNEHNDVDYIHLITNDNTYNHNDMCI